MAGRRAAFADGRAVVATMPGRFHDRYGHAQRARVLEVDGRRLALTMLETSILRHALEMARNDARLLDRLGAGGRRMPHGTREIVGGLLHFLLTGEYFDESDEITAWRRQALAEADRGDSDARGSNMGRDLDRGNTIPLPHADEDSQTCAEGRIEP